MNDAFDQWWEWAQKPLNSHLTIPGDIRYPIVALSDKDRYDRAKVNEAVRRYRASGVNSIGWRTIICIMLIGVFAITWNLLGY